MIDAGEEWQRFAKDCLSKCNLPYVMNYESKFFQYEYGENGQGIEFKYQIRYAETGNLWIEFAEKAHPDRDYYVDSGILRKDNSWAWATGDYSIIYLFSKKQLIGWYKNYAPSLNYFRVLENNTKTSKGYLMPKAWAIDYSLMIIDIINRQPKIRNIDGKKSIINKNGESKNKQLKLFDYEEK